MHNISSYLPVQMAGCFLFLWPVVSVGEEMKPYMHSDVFLQSEPITINGALNEWQEGKYRGGESQYSSIWLEAGVEKVNTAVAALYRQEHQSVFTTDAADYYYGTQQHQLDPDRTYQLKLETNAFKATGLRAQHKFQATEQLTVAIGGSLLQAKGLQDGTLVGQATTDSSGKDQSYHAVVDYQYDQDKLLDRPDVIAPQGIGYALDARLDWQATERLGVNLVVKDILGEIHWNDVPYTSATLTSDVKTVGSDGFIKVQPSVSGKEGYLDSFRQTLHPKVDAQAKYQFDRNGKSISALVKHVSEKTMWGIGGELPVANRQLSVSLFPEENFLNIGYSGKRSELSIGMDSFDPGSANTVWVSFGLH